MKIGKAVANGAVLAVSLCLSALMCEVGARWLLEPADYLSVEMVPDRILGAVPSSTAAGGFDAWGFRNRSVPGSADIVAIGDSHTYGNTATMEDSWPYGVGRITGRVVYNMGLGGYGPNQYRHLLETRALSLRPRTVVLGLYMGDDFENAYLITYGLEHWTRLRARQEKGTSFDIWANSDDAAWHKQIRVWLSRHSVVYQLLLHGPLTGHLQGNVQIRNAEGLNPDAASLLVSDAGISEAFLPRGILKRLDQSDPSIREGMRITFELLDEIKALCDQKGANLLVAVIPTKEMVFAGYLENNPTLALGEVFDRLLANERLAREATFKRLDADHINYVDTLSALQAARGQELYARTASDMHPNGNGYRVIAEAVAEALAKAEASK